METIEKKFKRRDYEVRIRFPEFTCLCPMTSQPDFAEIIIEYVPLERLVELKSLKILMLKMSLCIPRAVFQTFAAVLISHLPEK